ncbi:MAG: hypothetical protein IKQ16_05345 [Lentisphaeria bacterium]|nr:hypothetical protein [Lentisphaeria bacterium]
MMFHTTDGFNEHSGSCSAVPLSAVRDIASVRIASDAIISIIITQAAR